MNLVFPPRVPTITTTFRSLFSIMLYGPLTPVSFFVALITAASSVATSVAPPMVRQTSNYTCNTGSPPLCCDVAAVTYGPSQFFIYADSESYNSGLTVAFGCEVSQDMSW